MSWSRLAALVLILLLAGSSLAFASESADFVRLSKRRVRNEWTGIHVYTGNKPIKTLSRNDVRRIERITDGLSRKVGLPRFARPYLLEQVLRHVRFNWGVAWGAERRGDTHDAPGVITLPVLKIENVPTKARTVVKPHEGGWKITTFGDEGQMTADALLTPLKGLFGWFGSWQAGEMDAFAQLTSTGFVEDRHREVHTVLGPTIAEEVRAPSAKREHPQPLVPPASPRGQRSSAELPADVWPGPFLETR